MSPLLSPAVWLIICGIFFLWTVIVGNKNYQPQPTCDSDVEETGGLEGFLAGTKFICLAAITLISLIMFIITLVIRYC